MRAIFLFILTILFLGITSAQTLHMSISTRSVEGFGKPGVKVWVGPYSVTTGEAGVASLDIPAGTYTARAETKCRVANVSPSINLNSLRTGGTPTEPILTFTAPQQFPLGISFELDCKNIRAPGRTSGKTVRRKRSKNK